MQCSAGGYGPWTRGGNRRAPLLVRPMPEAIAGCRTVKDLHEMKEIKGGEQIRLVFVTGMAAE